MSQSVVLSFSAQPDASLLLQTTTHASSYRKRITMKHPDVMAWAQSGASLRISLRVKRGGDGMITLPSIEPVAAISGPFFDGADG